ncbi:MAG: triose-phosphate isomerase [Bacteroidetes bacterium]|jgi:triosephosphate isomerase|nr:triose-phosphate isomerase [Bacteroidota bacterium]
MIIAGNWKMNLDLQSALDLVQSISKEKISESIEVRMAVPSLYLTKLLDCVQSHPQLTIGAQNIHSAKSGAFTGEISAPMLVSCGVPWTIIAHSERRQQFGETDEVARLKCKQALEHDLGVILCVGEPESVRIANKEKEYVEKQLLASVPRQLADAAWNRMVIAYEPVWAIGTGLTASPEQAQEMHEFIRSLLKTSFSNTAAQSAILYGGSMKPANANSLLSQRDIDGGLIGGASLKADSFLDIIRQAEK